MPDYTGVHPICVKLRDLRRAAGLSLGDAEELTGISRLTIGSYERGDRIPPLHKLDPILSAYGYKLDAVPANPQFVRLPGDIAADLRMAANQIEQILT